MDRPLVAVVLAGGTGTRLYPATRSDRPKQHRSFGGDGSLLRATVDRAAFADECYVLTRAAFADDVHEHAPNAAVLTEPHPRDTGPALVYAAHRIRAQVGECVMLVLPSDHHVEGDFEGTARRAAEVAIETEGLVTVGVEPTRPETGYGYVEPGGERDGYAPVARFHEKPAASTAREYVDGGCYWNAGTFAWTPTAFLQAVRETPLETLLESLEGDGETEAFERVEPISVDYAVLERADEVYVVPADFEWDDLGAWDAIGRLHEADADGNVMLGSGLAIDARDNVVATDGHVSLVGVDDLVVASYDDRMLVVPRAEAQRVREVVSELQADGRF